MNLGKTLDALSDELHRIRMATTSKQYESRLKRPSLTAEFAEQIIARGSKRRAKAEEVRQKRAAEQEAWWQKFREENALRKEALEAGYRVLAKKSHPDVGGSTEQMQ